MQQVDGEAHPAQEQQVPPAQEPLQRRAEQDPQADELEPDAAGEAGEVRVLGQDGPHEVQEDARPGHPLGVALGEGGEREADEDEGGGEDLAEAGTVGYELCRGRVVLQVCDEGAPEELHAEGR